jgi:hypothetical protein
MPPETPPQAKRRLPSWLPMALTLAGLVFAGLFGAFAWAFVWHQDEIFLWAFENERVPLVNAMLRLNPKLAEKRLYFRRWLFSDRYLTPDEEPKWSLAIIAARDHGHCPALFRAVLAARPKIDAEEWNRALEEESFFVFGLPDPLEKAILDLLIEGGADPKIIEGIENREVFSMTEFMEDIPCPCEEQP